MSEDLQTAPEISDVELSHVPDEIIQQELKRLLAKDTGLSPDDDMDSLLDAFKGNDLVSVFATATPDEKSSIIEAAAEARKNGEATDDQLEVLAAVEHGAALAREVQSQSTENETEQKNDDTSDKAIDLHASPKREPVLLEPESDRIIGDLSLDGVKGLVANIEAEISAKKFMGDDVSDLEDQLVTQKDLLNYLEQRDYYDPRTDRVHQADDKRFVSKEQANESDYELKDEHIPHANKSMQRLVSDWAKAEDLGDKTTSLDIQDELYARLEAEGNVSDDLKLALIDRLHADMLQQRQTGDIQGGNPADAANNADPTTSPDDANQADDQNGPDAGTQQPEQGARRVEVIVPQRIEAAFALAKGTLRAVAERANDDMNAEKSDLAQMSNWNPLKWARMMKYSTVAKKATETFRAVGHMRELLQAEQSTGSGRLTTGRFFEILRGAGAAVEHANQSAMIEATLDESLRRPGDEVLDSDTSEHPVFGQVRDQLKEFVLEHLDATRDYAAMSEQDRQTADARYQERCDEFFAQLVKDNPNLFTDPEAFTVVSGNALEIARQARQLFEAENGREAADAALSDMKIALGHIQLGPNSDYNTEYIDKSLAKMRTRGVAQAVGGAALVGGTWAIGGAIAYGLAEQAKISAASSGTRYAAGIAGGIAFGPVGAVAAYGGGVVASAIIGGVMARRRAQEAIELADVKSGDSGELFDSQLLEALSYDRVHAPQLTAAMREGFLSVQFVDAAGNIVDNPEPGVEYEERIALRSDLSVDNVAEIATLTQDVQARLAIEARRQAMGEVTNLISTDSPELALPQRQELIKTCTLLQDLLSQRYGADGIPTGIFEANEQGEQVEVMVPLADVTALGARLSERITSIEADMQHTDAIRDTYKSSEGWRGVRRAGMWSAVLGFGAAGVTELVTDGGAHTIIDTASAGVREIGSLGNASTMWDGVFSNPPNGIAPAPGNLPPSWNSQTEVHTSPSGTTEVTLPKGFTVDYQTYPNGDKYAEITAPSGTKPFGGVDHTTVDITAAGKFAKADVSELRQWGFEVDTTKGARTDYASFSEFWEANKSRPEVGSGSVQDTDWADYGTRVSERNELGLRMGSTPDGGERFSAYVQGESWNNSGISETPLELAKKGELYFVSRVGDQYISFKADYHDGIATVDVPEWAQGIYHRNPNGGPPIGPTLHIAQIKGNGDIVSFATVPGDDGAVSGFGTTTVKITPPTVESIPDPEGGIEPAGFTIPGYVPTVTRDTLYDTRERREPVPPQPIPAPTPGPEPAPQPIDPVIAPPEVIVDNAAGLQIEEIGALINAANGQLNNTYVNVVMGNTNEPLPQPGWLVGQDGSGGYVIQHDNGNQTVVPQADFERLVTEGRFNVVKTQLRNTGGNTAPGDVVQPQTQTGPEGQAPAQPEQYPAVILQAPSDLTAGRTFIDRAETGDFRLVYDGPEADGSYRFINEFGEPVVWRAWQVEQDIAAGRFSQVASDGSEADYPEQLNPVTPQTAPVTPPQNPNQSQPDTGNTYTDENGNTVRELMVGNEPHRFVRNPNGEIVSVVNLATGADMTEIFRSLNLR